MAALLLFLFFLLTSSVVMASPEINFDITDFGAKGDGKTDLSPALLRTWAAACSSQLPAKIYVPRRRYFLRPIILEGPCNSSEITVQLDGSLVAPDFVEMESVDNWIMLSSVEGLSFHGGYLNGVGSALWTCKAGQQSCPAGPTSLAIYGSKNVEIQNLTSINAKLYHVVIHSCQNVMVQGVRIYAPENSPNTDGIHVQNAIDVSIMNTGIKTGDDCISIGPGTKNLWIQEIACGPGHGISIGSLGKGLEEDGVQNVTVKNVVFTGTQNGLRIKSWGRPSNGFVTGVVFKQVVMNNVQNPIVIDQNYCPRNEGCPNQNSGIKISQVTYADIKGTSASQVAMKFDCSEISPCKGIGLQNIELTYQDQPAQSFCKNVRGIARGLVTPPSCL